MIYTLRPANADDARRLWEWRDDPEVRRQSYTTEALVWETHVAWLARALASHTTRLWIFEADGRPVGQVRYECSGDEAMVSLSVAGGERGRGYGRALLEMSVPRACRELGVRLVFGLVKEGNTPSVRAFEAAGFSRAGAAVIEGSSSLRFEMACPPDVGRAGEGRGCL